jgi:cytidylate kinase
MSICRKRRNNTIIIMKKITIAIDGHSSCGKSTMAKDLARRLGYIYVDTCAMYRCVTLFALRRGLFAPDGTIDTDQLQALMPSIAISFQFNAEAGRPDAYLNGKNVEKLIRTMEVSSHVSPVAALPFVRAAMTAQQQAMGREGGIVMDGRDIGTAVFPDAELKIFVTASDEIRAQRRYDELVAKGATCDFQQILENLRERDRIDSTRSVAPLRQAEDALVLDNSHMTIPEQKQWLLEKFRERTLSPASPLQGKE